MFGQNLRRWLLLIGLTSGVAGCDLFPFSGGGDPVPPEILELPRALTAAELGVREASNGFGFSLLREIVREEPTLSHFLSPLSASMALGMTLNGADGETWEGMRSTLGFQGLSESEINAAYRGLIDLLSGLDPRVTFTLANSVWHTDQLRPLDPFVRALETSFDAEVRAIDFRAPTAPATLNAWVKAKTQGRIASIVDDPLPSAVEIVAYLLNAIYFKAEWTEGFDRAKTRTGLFQLPGGRTAEVRYMVRSGGFRLAVTEAGTFLDLPYGGKAYSMTVLLPHDPDGLPDLVRGLDPARWQEGIDRLSPVPGATELHLPRFTLEWERSLKEVLSALGMDLAFRDGHADFSRLFGAQGPFLTEVKQKTFVKVDEVGTEAAAVTSVGVGVTSMPQAIAVDRPFVVAIRERLSGTLLFLGAVSQAPTD
jgi:serine protease inhibitor